LPEAKKSLEYAEEADVLNLELFQFQGELPKIINGIAY
jgi:hypothetical protein